MKKVLIFLIALYIFLRINNFFFPLEKHSQLWPYMNTVFSENFSWHNFSNLKIGMSKNEVNHLIGKPIDIFNLKGYGGSECWMYSHDGTILELIIADISWYRPQVCFKNSKVINFNVLEFSD